nr:MAG TPA: hypothetical protein [Caudoviricetes sp.]
MTKIIARANITIIDVNDGKKGDAGDPALTLVVTPNTFVFQTNNKGIIENLAQNAGTVKMYLGKTEVPIDNASAKPYNCDAVVNKQQLAGQGGPTQYLLTFRNVSEGQWSGKVEVTATYKGQTRTAIAEFVVSAQKWNEAQFLANDQQFKSIIAQNKADKQGLEKRMSVIEQDAEKIRLEVSKQTFGGVNLLKGASLRRDEVSLIAGKSHRICMHETAKIRRDPQGHNRQPYLEINVSGKLQDLYSSGRFWVYLEKGKMYVFSMYYKIFGYATSNVSIDVALCNDYTGAPQKWIAGEGGDTFVKDYTWRKYTRRYVIDTTGYYFFAPVLQRNGRVQFSEIQLEEGTNATGWQDPDIVDSVERTGIDLVNGTVSVEAANFEIKHNGEKPFVVSKGRALLGGWVFDKGRLFSQCGDVDGNPSRDYANPRFNPDIVLDPTNGYMSGVGSFRKKMLVVTPQNISQYAERDEILGYSFPAGKISAVAMFKGNFDREIFITLPREDGATHLEVARSLIGEVIAIYNQSSRFIAIMGPGESITINPGEFAALEVKLSVNPYTGKESFFNTGWIKGKMLV